MNQSVRGGGAARESASSSPASPLLRSPQPITCHLTFLPNGADRGA